MQAASVRVPPLSAVTDRPGLALAAAAVGIALLPLLVPKLPANAAPVDAFLLLAIGGSLMWAALAGHRVRLPYAIPVTILVLAGALAAMLGEYPLRGGLAVVQDLMLLGWGAAVANLARTPEALAVLLRAWAWSATAWATILVVAVVAGLGSIGGFEVEGGRAELTFGNPNLAGNYFAVSLMVFWIRPRPARRMPSVAASALLLSAILLTGSNSAIGGLVAGVLVACVVSVTRKRGPIPALAVSIVIVSAAILTALSIQRSNLIEAAQQSPSAVVRNSVGRTERSGEDRMDQARQLFNLFRAQGVFGHGPAATEQVLLAQRAPYVREAHNDYAAVLVERGVFGGVGLLLLIGSVGIRAVRLSDGVSERYRRAVSNVPLLIGALVAVAIGSLFHEMLHYRHIWALLGILAGLDVWGRSSQAEVEDA
jgi:hypothetical protein